MSKMSSQFMSAIKKQRMERHSTVVGKSPAQVERRNARERRRVQQVNAGYEHLARQLTEWDEYKNKKLTKAETLKAAIEYIRHLETMLNANSGGLASAYGAAAAAAHENHPHTASPGPPRAAFAYAAAYGSPSSASSSSSSLGPNVDFYNDKHFYYVKQEMRTHETHYMQH